MELMEASVYVGDGVLGGAATSRCRSRVPVRC